MLKCQNIFHSKRFLLAMTDSDEVCVYVYFMHSPAHKCLSLSFLPVYLHRSQTATLLPQHIGQNICSEGEKSWVIPHWIKSKTRKQTVVVSGSVFIVGRVSLKCDRRVFFTERGRGLCPIKGKIFKINWKKGVIFDNINYHFLTVCSMSQPMTPIHRSSKSIQNIKNLSNGGIFF